LIIIDYNEQNIHDFQNLRPCIFDNGEKSNATVYSDRLYQ